jgi:hypothetical protein
MSLSLLAPDGRAQNPQTPPPQAPPPPQVNPSTQAAIAAQAAQAAPKPPASTVPDYPDPRDLTIGAFYFLPVGQSEPSIFGGGQSINVNGTIEAPPYETLTNLGKLRKSPGIELSLPITRTGSIHIEAFRVQSTSNEYAPASTTIYGQAINQGDYLAISNKVSTAKLYLDDLLFPHKFPVARFRLKSLWGFQYASMSTNANAPLVPLNSAGAGEDAVGSRSIYLPTFGLAAEYAIAPHVLLRVDASGFGIPHHSDLWNADATVAWRIGYIEVIVGAKAFHMKSSPRNSEYAVATLPGAFVGLEWHSPLLERQR